MIMSSDVPDIQEVFLKQLEEEAAKRAEEAALAGSSTSTEVAKLETEMRQVALTEDRSVASLVQRLGNTLPARDKPEKSVRLMKEQGMLRKY